MKPASAAGDPVEAVVARIRRQRLRWLTALHDRENESASPAAATAFPRSRTLRYVLAHPKTVAIAVAGVLLLRRGWSGKLGMLLLQRFALRRFDGR